MKRRIKRNFVTVPEVSDHAVVRYLERVDGVDIEKVRAHIADVCRVAVAAGALSLKSNGMQFIFRDRVVVTVKPNGIGRATEQQLRELAE